jgi:hypothetical protein
LGKFLKFLGFRPRNSSYGFEVFCYWDWMIEFYVDALSQKLPVDEFETIPTCKVEGIQDSVSYLEASI